MLLDGDEWNACFDTMQREAWRLETLPVYTMPQEAEKLARFLAGENSPDDYTSGWMDEVRQWRSEGKSAGRVHVITRPLSDYLRFEFEYYYQHHVKAGEKIRILDVTDRPNPLPDVQDFWMFDRAKVVLMNYREDGTQISRELYEGDPAPFIEYQRIAVTESVGLLSTPEYIRGSLAHSPVDTSKTVAKKLERQQVLYDPWRLGGPSSPPRKWRYRLTGFPRLPICRMSVSVLSQ